MLLRLREALGDRLVYVFRHFPDERAHPGAELVARASEAAGRQGQFWQTHDRIYDREPPITERVLLDLARELGLDIDRFRADMRGDETRQSVEEDVEEARANGVTGTPTFIVDGVRYGSPSSRAAPGPPATSRCGSSSAPHASAAWPTRWRC